MHSEFYYDYPEYYGYSTAGDSILGFIVGFFATMWLFAIVCLVIQIIGQWKTYKKAGLDGWEALVPGHNIFVKFQLAGIHTAFFFLLCVPVANIFIDFWLNIEFAKKFGRSVGFGIGLTILPVIFYPILGFGKSEYLGTKTGKVTANSVKTEENKGEEK